MSEGALAQPYLKTGTGVVRSKVRATPTGGYRTVSVRVVRRIWVTRSELPPSDRPEKNGRELWYDQHVANRPVLPPMQPRTPGSQNAPEIRTSHGARDRQCPKRCRRRGNHDTRPQSQPAGARVARPVSCYVLLATATHRRSTCRRVGLPAFLGHAFGVGSIFSG